MDAIIGSIFIGATEGTVWGGTEFHVLLYEQDVPGVPVIEPDIASTVNDLIPVRRLDGEFPGTASDAYLTTNYMITDTPPGEYFLFVWIDADASGTYDPNYDLLGFYDAMADFNFVWSEPPSPNVVVPPTGLLDIDVWVGTLVLPG